VWEVYQNIASYLLQATRDNVSARRKRHSTSPALFKTTSQLLQVSNIVGEEWRLFMHAFCYWVTIAMWSIFVFL
jgi:hypothetical protein